MTEELDRQHFINPGRDNKTLARRGKSKRPSPLKGKKRVITWDNKGGRPRKKEVDKKRTIVLAVSFDLWFDLTSSGAASAMVEKIYQTVPKDKIVQLKKEVADDLYLKSLKSK